MIDLETDLLKTKSKFMNLSKEKTTALMIVSIYASISVFWILLSDRFIVYRLADFLNLDKSDILAISMIKGSIYVLVSSILLYLGISKNLVNMSMLKSNLDLSEERYHNLIKLLPDTVTIIENDKYIYTNDAGAELFGFNDPEQIFGKPVNNLTHPKYHKAMLEQLTDYKNDTNCILTEQKYIRANGDTIDVEVTSRIFTHNGKPNILSVIRDITERKKIEASLKKTLEENKLLLEKMMHLDKVKTEFFTNMSHEFKTPLNIIYGIVQLLETYSSKGSINVSPSKLSNYTHLMKQNCYRLLRLINNLIDITKNESNFLDMNYKNINIVNLIENITQSVVDFAKNKEISIIFDTEVEEKIIACDVDKIERIILNLLSNSIKFTKYGGLINVDIYDNDNTILISVKDNGIGIPEDKLNLIFDRFVQVDSSLQRENEGSGIGLALVKSLVENHGGRIWVESKLNSGTNFFIEFPVKQLPDEIESLNSVEHNDTLVEKINIEFSDIY